MSHIAIAIDQEDRGLHQVAGRQVVTYELPRLVVILVVVLSFGEIFFSPIASSIVSDMAPESIRGRYMGAWTVMWSGGISVGPLLGGILIGSIGGRPAFGTMLVLGVIGAVLFLLLSTGRPLETITEEGAPVVRDAERPT